MPHLFHGRSFLLAPVAGSLQYEYVAPNKLASSTVAREKSDIDRFLLHIGHYKLTELRSEHFRKLYVVLRKEKNMINGKPLSELTVEGVHACLCGILSDAVESGLLDHNPAWRTYKYSNIDKKQQVVADEEILQTMICALEKESIKYETYFKLITKEVSLMVCPTRFELATFRVGAFRRSKKRPSRVRLPRQSALGDKPIGAERLHSSFIACQKQPAHGGNIAPGYRLAAVAASIQLFNSRAKQAAGLGAAPV